MKVRRLVVLTALVAACAALGVFSFVVLKRHPLSLAVETEWAIGVYTGDSPYRLHDGGQTTNPSITREHVVDVNAEYVADPFIIRDGSTWYMFYEVMDSIAGRGVIGLSESDDGFQWRYRGIVLREQIHLSYPYVFAADGNYYMIPESAQSGYLRLYRATEFPTTWEHVTNLMEGDFQDSSIVRYDGLWWIFSCVNWATHDELRVYYSESLLGPWISHPRNPIVEGDLSVTRAGGRMLVAGDGILRFVQDDRRTYGKAVRAFLVTELTKTTYKEVLVKPDPILSATGRGWNRHGMHQIDAVEVEPGRWLAAVDGYKKHLTVQLEY